SRPPTPRTAPCAADIPPGRRRGRSDPTACHRESGRGRTRSDVRERTAGTSRVYLATGGNGVDGGNGNNTETQRNGDAPVKRAFLRFLAAPGLDRDLVFV